MGVLNPILSWSKKTGLVVTGAHFVPYKYLFEHEFD